MTKLFLNSAWVLMLMLSVSANGQLLPDNKSLNAQSVQRWMQTNRDIEPFIRVVDAMHVTDTDLKSFDALAPVEQDKKINDLLKSKNLLHRANQVTQKHGWISVGEYMRLGAKLGNAIAAYFLFGDLGAVTEEQAQQLKEKSDPAVLAVPKSDIDFVKKNEKALQKYIKAYSAG